MRWATRTSVHIDRAACAWLIHRFIDDKAEFLFVAEVEEVPADATAFDMRGVDLSHHGADCSFETILRRYNLDDPVLWRIAAIVHEADLNDERYDAPEAPGFDVALRGLSMIPRRRRDPRTDRAAVRRGLRIPPPRDAAGPGAGVTLADPENPGAEAVVPAIFAHAVFPAVLCFFLRLGTLGYLRRGPLGAAAVARVRRCVVPDALRRRHRVRHRSDRRRVQGAGRAVVALTRQAVIDVATGTIAAVTLTLLWRSSSCLSPT
jgi:hypothetical protein